LALAVAGASAFIGRSPRLHLAPIPWPQRSYGEEACVLIDSAPDYGAAPRYVYWEMTQVCGLACRHCRATSKRVGHPDELTTDEGKALIREVAAFGTPAPTMIFSGGDPLERPDLWELLDYAHGLGIPTAVTPSATPTLTRDHFVRLKAHHVSAVSMSLDGASAKRHDGIRNVGGCFEYTMRAWEWTSELEIPLLVNTVVSEASADDIPAIYELLLTKKLVRWSLFFLIAVGRGRYLVPVSTERAESIMQWMAERSLEAPFVIGSTEAPSYRRIALDLLAERGWSDERIAATPLHAGFGIRDGNGVAFVSKIGDVYPTGFLPLSGGNVRQRGLVDIYRNSDLFTSIRDLSRFGGACGACTYKAICGGSRARAYAFTGDPLAADPICSYTPAPVAV
jgi:radical SAM protein